MKLTSRVLFLFISLTAIAFLSRCKNPCKGISCLHGDCVDGTCVCEPGYSGLHCDTRATHKFAGEFSLSEDCNSPGSNPYNCTILESSVDSSQLVFANLFNGGIEVTATVDESGSGFTIPGQDYGTGTISGSGTINSSADVITMNYTVNIATGVSVCNATLTRN